MLLHPMRLTRRSNSTEELQRMMTVRVASQGHEQCLQRAYGSNGGGVRDSGEAGQSLSFLELPTSETDANLVSMDRSSAVLDDVTSSPAFVASPSGHTQQGCALPRCSIALQLDEKPQAQQSARCSPPCPCRGSKQCREWAFWGGRKLPGRR